MACLLLHVYSGSGEVGSRRLDFTRVIRPSITTMWTYSAGKRQNVHIGRVTS